jgi:hypothetical protein
MSASSYSAMPKRSPTEAKKITKKLANYYSLSSKISGYYKK